MHRRRTALSFTAFVMLTMTAACNSDPTGPDTTVQDDVRIGAIHFTASAQVLPNANRTLRVTLLAHNETDFMAQAAILGGPCMLRPRLYTEAGGRLVWSAFDLHNACPEPLRTFDLEGGGQEEVTESFEVDVGTGDYFATVTIETAEGLVELAAGEVTVR